MKINKPIIKLDFVDFWDGFDKYNNDFTKILSPYFKLEIGEDADFLFYSVFGNESFRNFKGIRIFYTGENVKPNLKECDFALSFDYSNHPRHYRLPNFIRRLIIEKKKNPKVQIEKPKDINEIIKRKTKFCSFLFSNPNALERINFFKKLSKYKQVDSAGKVLNNLGFTTYKRIEFHSSYKFNICFENTSHPGYTTEKILYAMLADCIPIYWGDPLIHNTFNPKSFVNINDFPTVEDAIDHIIEIDSNEELYRSYLSESFLYTSEKELINEEVLIDFFKNIFKQKDKLKPIAQHPFYPIWNKGKKLFNRISKR